MKPNNYCLYSFKKKRFSLYRNAINFLLSPFFTLFILVMITLKGFNTVLYYVQDNLIFTNIFFPFCNNALMYGFDASSMLESLSIRLALE